MTTHYNSEITRKMQRAITARGQALPSNVEDTIVPVLIVNEGGSAAEVQPGLPRNNRKQTMIVHTNYASSATVTRTIISPSNTQDIYFVGASIWLAPAAGNATVNLLDSTTATGPTDNAVDCLIRAQIAAGAASQIINVFPPVPIKISKALRVLSSSNPGEAICLTYYIVEAKEAGE